MDLNQKEAAGGLFKSAAAASFEDVDPLESVLKEITASHGKKNGRRLTAKPHEIQESQKNLLRVSIPDAAGVSSSATTNCTSTQSASQHDGHQAHNPFTTANRHADVYYGQEGAEEDEDDG